MYGAMWTMIALFFWIPVFGNLGQYLKKYSDDELDTYASSIRSLWKLMGLLLIYFFFVPFILHNVFRFGSGIGSSDSRYFFIASIYGYCFWPFVPGIMIHCLPNIMIQWASILIAATSSLIFLAREMFHLAQSSLSKKKFKLVAGIMCILHLAFIVLLKMWFL